MAVISNVKVGKADVKMSLPSHVPGIREGNAKGNLKKEPGLDEEGGLVKGTARRSTGINARRREPIDPRMPNMSPS